jgi:hypothetical protein
LLPFTRGAQSRFGHLWEWPARALRHNVNGLNAVSDPEAALQLRRQRNRAAIAAVVITVAALLIAVPRALERRSRLKATNEELIALQGQIGALQGQIRDTQLQIAQAQAQIGALLKQRR